MQAFLSEAEPLAAGLPLRSKGAAGAGRHVFTTAQILGMVVGLDPAYDDTLKIAAGRVALVSYAESRDKGDEIASKILQNSNLTTLARKRPSKLIEAMDHALVVIAERKAERERAAGK